MPGKPKISKFQAVDDERSIIVPKEMVKEEIPESIQASSRQVNKLLKEKKPRSEAQIAAAKKLGELTRARLEAARKQKEEHPEIVEQKKQAARQAKEEAKKKAEEEERERKRQEQAAQLAAGTHVKIYIKEKKPRGRYAKKKVEETETDTITETETEVPTDTEDETDIEEYKKKARVAHRAKKVVRTIQKIDQVLQQPVAVNPYAALLASRWR